MATSDKSKYSSNQYLSQTADSHDKAVKLGVFHVAKIKALRDASPLDADYILMYDRSAPLTADAQTKYNVYYHTEDAQIGQGKLIDLRVKGIKGKTGKARDWFNRISAIYLISDPARLAAIFPHGLKPFRGKKDAIIQALNTLSLNIGDDANVLMVAIKAEVDAEYTFLNPGRNDQVSAIALTGIKSGDVDASCHAIMVMEYRNIGLMIDKWPANPDDIQESIHDMELLLSKQQKIWDIHLDPLENKDIATRTQVFNSKFKAKVIGGGAKMYLASTPNGIDSDPVVLVDGIEKDFTAADFHVADYGVNRHITIISSAGVIISFKLKLGN